MKSHWLEKGNQLAAFGPEPPVKWYLAWEMALVKVTVRELADEQAEERDAGLEVPGLERSLAIAETHANQVGKVENRRLGPLGRMPNRVPTPFQQGTE